MSPRDIALIGWIRKKVDLNCGIMDIQKYWKRGMMIEATVKNATGEDLKKAVSEISKRIGGIDDIGDVVITVQRK